MNGFKKVSLALGCTFALGACASTPTSPTPGPLWDAESLVGSMWTELCPDTDPDQTWIALYEDGTFAYLYPDQEWTYEGIDRWSVENGELVVSWQNGYAVSHYPLQPGTRLPGRTTKGCQISLEYVGPAPDLEFEEVPGDEPVDESEFSGPMEARLR